MTPDTWAVVNGKAITRDEVEKVYRRTRDVSQNLPDEEAMAAKLALLNDLILQEILRVKAATLKIEVPPAELDTAYNDAKKNITDEAFQQELTKRGLTAADMRDGLARELLTQKVIAQEVGAKVSVTDQEIADFFNANKHQFNMPEESYHLAQIVITPEREQQITNRSGDDATSPEAANAKLQAILERLKAGADFRDMAAGFSEDAETAPRGGDLGFIPISRLKAAPPTLRNAVIGREAGSVNLSSAGGAHTLVLVVAHELAGQRDLSTPGVKDRISQTLRGRKEQLLRGAYLIDVRGDAQVTNYLAKQLVQGSGKVPTVSLAAPGSK